MHRRAALAITLAAALVAGCAAQTGVGFNTVLGYEGLGRQIEVFYAQRAWERNATCPNPRIDTILRAEVIEETEDEIVARVRYSWRDSSRLEGSRTGVRLGVGAGNRCRGIDQRRFTLERAGEGVRVVAMSGAQRPEPIPRGRRVAP